MLPGYPTPPPYHYQAFVRPFDFCYYGLCNIFQLPATQVPIGITKEGLPIGIQVSEVLKFYFLKAFQLHFNFGSIKKKFFVVLTSYYCLACNLIPYVPHLLHFLSQVALPDEATSLLSRKCHSDNE